MFAGVCDVVAECAAVDVAVVVVVGGVVVAVVGRGCGRGMVLVVFT